ncbi:MAG: ABC transporter ATP-binding protein, partial [Clostridia bacterium]|nr:ABC transporter ATP-binding protein [Clostridia bacterium]
MNNQQKFKRRIDSGILLRVLKLLFKSYPVLIPIVISCIVFSAAVSASPSIFTQKVLAVITECLETGVISWEIAKVQILPKVAILIVLYALSLILATLQTQLMAYITQGFLSKMRCTLFDGMQNLPIRYFDTNKHGDIMSYY